MSPETAKRRSESKQKKVLVTDNETGIQEVYNSLKEIAERFSVTTATVTRWCRKLRKPSVNYTFDYL